MTWHPPSERPNLDCGDRIVLIVREREREGAPLVDRLVILEAAEDGWAATDPTYDGYDPSDGEAWAYETAILATVKEFTP